MGRTTPTFAVSGLVLDRLGAVGWHFQPVFGAGRTGDRWWRRLVRGLPHPTPSGHEVDSLLAPRE